jgi:hypothetical protein
MCLMPIATAAAPEREKLAEAARKASMTALQVTSWLPAAGVHACGHRMLDPFILDIWRFARATPSHASS